MTGFAKAIESPMATRRLARDETSPPSLAHINACCAGAAKDVIAGASSREDGAKVDVKRWSVSYRQRYVRGGTVGEQGDSPAGALGSVAAGGGAAAAVGFFR